MKRLLSWLLALVMIISCLPMSAIPAFAAEEDTDPTLDVGVTETTHDWEVDIDEVDREYIDLATVVTDPGEPFNVTIPAGETVYYRGALNPYANMEASINYGAPVALTVEGNFAYLEITNETDAEATYTVCVDFPVGHMENPVEMGNIIVSRWGGGFSDTAVVPAGNINFYYYTYTGEGDGSIYLSLNSLPTVTVTDEETGETTDYEATCDIVINDGEKTLLNDGVDGTLTYDVTEGQIVKIQVVIVEDYNGVYLPGGSVGFTGYFEAAPGTELNPLNPWTWNDDYTVANASVTVPEGETLWYVAQYGMILTVNGVETAQEGIFSLTAGTYELQMTYPVGHTNNPEVIGEMPYTDDGITVDGDPEYYKYIWTAEEDGTVTIDVTDGANLEIEKWTYVEGQDWPNTVQYVLAETANVVYGEDGWTIESFDWVVQENITIDVVAGEEIRIKVYGINNENPYATPATEYTLTASFEAAEPEVVIYDIPVSATNLEFADELFLSAKLKLPEEIMNDANAIVRMQINGGNTDFLVADLVAAGLDSSGRVKVKQPIMSPYMDKMVTIYVIDGNGNAHNFIYSEVKHEGSYVFSVDNYLKLAFAQGDSYKTTKDLLVALLTYGSAAQDYFTMRGGVPNISETPASQLLEKYGYSALDLSKFSADSITQEVIKEGAQNGVTFKNCTPAFEAALYMTMKFESDGSYDMNDYTYTLKYYDASSRTEKTTELVPFKDNQGRFCVKIENVAAALWDYMYKVTVTNNVTGESYSASYSVMCYVKAAVAAYANDAVRLAFFKSLYYYNQAANARFGV